MLKNVQYTVCLTDYAPMLIKGECSVFLQKFVLWIKTNTLSEYNMIPLGHNRTNGAVYSKIYFKVEICSAPLNALNFN